jgi:ribonucleoside-triphosphate reductase
MFIDEYIRNHENNPFTFPVMTAAYLIDDKKNPKDEDFYNFICEANVKNGLFNFYADETTASLSSCCRLKSDISASKKTDYTNSFGVGGLNIGSHRVVTLNLPQIAYMAEDWEHYMKLLEHRISLAQDVLDTHRDIMKKLIKDGKLPLYSYGFMFLERQFSTLGFIGINEALEIMGFDILDDAGDAKVRQILEMFNSMNSKRTKVDGHLRNVEQVPGESAAYNFARKDHLLFANAKYNLYSNQYIPLTKETDIVHRIISQGRYDSSVGGGSILHLNVCEQLTPAQMKNLVKFTSAKGVMYFAVNYAFSQCQSCGKVYIGKLDKSPCHNAAIDKYIRVVGYLTPVSTWAKERRVEFVERQFYTSIKDGDLTDAPKPHKKSKLDMRRHEKEVEELANVGEFD